MHVSCPYCKRSDQVARKSYGKKAGACIGLTAGAISGAQGARIGAAFGAIAGPSGSVIGAIAGGLAGCVAGASMGDVIDREVLYDFHCKACDHSFSISDHQLD